jgi:hypothetical protein
MRRAVALTTAGVAGAAALAFGVPAIAATDDGSTATPSPSAPGLEDLEERREAAVQDFAERLAEELGADADEVAAALETVREEMATERAAERLAALEERLAQAVEDGDLTQEQADAILEAAESGVLGGMGGPGGGGRFHHGPHGGFGLFGGPGGAESDSSTDGSGTGFGST